jgi:molybdenum cofactor cytidylyltransferase
MVPMMDSPLSSLKVVVLAAGRSTRLGRPKALVSIHGVSLIRRTIAVLSQVTCQSIVVVTAPRAARMRVELRRCRVTFVANHGRARGLSTSVALALRKTRWSAGTLFLPVDFAELAPRDIKRLISRWRGAKRRVAARRISGRPATPLILPKFLYPRARWLIGDIGLRDLVAELHQEQLTLLEISSAAHDIDTAQDLADARRRAPRHLAMPRHARRSGV